MTVLRILVKTLGAGARPKAMQLNSKTSSPHRKLQVFVVLLFHCYNEKEVLVSQHTRCGSVTKVSSQNTSRRKRQWKAFPYKWFYHGHGEMVSSLHVKFPIRVCPLFLLKGVSVCPYAARA
jgi:hypothetical protein